MTGGSPSFARSRPIVVLTVRREGVGRFVPDALEQFLRGHDPALCGQQTLEDSELLRAEHEATTAAERHVAAGIEGQVAAFERRGQRGRRPTAERADASHELGEVERLGQVVVGAQAETLHSLLDRAGRRQHQYPTLGALSHKPAADLVAVNDGQVAVQDHDVVVSDGKMAECVVAVEDHVDRHALSAQSGRDGRGQDFVVFDYQDSHVCLAVLRLASASPSRPRRGAIDTLQGYPVRGDSQVTAAVTVLSPTMSYNRCDGFEATEEGRSHEREQHQR